MSGGYPLAHHRFAGHIPPRSRRNFVGLPQPPYASNSCAPARLRNLSGAMRKKSAPISVHAGRTEFLKINAARAGWRDSYHWVLSLNWPRFALFLVVSYIVINLVFATLYAIGGRCIA